MPCEILVGGEWIGVEESAEHVRAHVEGGKPHAWSRFTEADTGVEPGCAPQFLAAPSPAARRDLGRIVLVHSRK